MLERGYVTSSSYRCRSKIQTRWHWVLSLRSYILTTLSTSLIEKSITSHIISIMSARSFTII